MKEKFTKNGRNGICKIHIWSFRWTNQRSMVSWLERYCVYWFLFTLNYFNNRNIKIIYTKLFLILYTILPSIFLKIKESFVYKWIKTITNRAVGNAKRHDKILAAIFELFKVKYRHFIWLAVSFYEWLKEKCVEKMTALSARL